MTASEILQGKQDQQGAAALLDVADPQRVDFQEAVEDC
jgi:hypothetical protein